MNLSRSLRGRIKLTIGYVLIVFLGSASTTLAKDIEPPPLEITHPKEYAIIQRDSSGIGEIRIEGLCSTPNQQIEARFNKQEWVPISPCSIEKTFSGTLSGNVGQGPLSVRYVSEKNSATSVPMISVGDIFLVAGQSNAGGYSHTLYQPQKNLPFQPVMFRQEGINSWKPLTDPTLGPEHPRESRQGSVWPVALSHVAKVANVPIGVINAAAGGSWIKQWQKSKKELYPLFLQTASTATHGSMKVRAILWFQGEADCNQDPRNSHISTSGNYERYKGELLNLVTDLKNDLHFDTFYVGVIGNVPHKVGEDIISTRQSITQIRRALQDSWENPMISPGPITYDIPFTSDPWHIHFDSPDEILPLAFRWGAAINASTYGVGQGMGPKLLKAELIPGGKQIALHFDQPLMISDYRGQPGSKAEGWFISNQNLPVSQHSLESTTIVGNTVFFDLNTSLSSSATISYAIDHDAAGKMILRGKTGLPIIPFLRIPLMGELETKY